MATIQVDIVSAEGEIHTGEAVMVFAPASMGEVGIAPRHAPMLTTLKPGEVRVQDAEGGQQPRGDVLGLLESIDDVLSAHPRLSREGVLAAIAFAARALRADVVYPTPNPAA